MRGRAAAAVLALLVALAACGRGEGLDDTRRALEQAGYSEVDVSVRGGGGTDVAVVEATGVDAERVARIVWDVLPVRFDQLVVSLGPEVTTDTYEALAGRFGPRTPNLDHKQVSDQVVRDGLDLMLVLTVGAVLSVAGVVALALVVVRAVRGRRPDNQAEGPISGLADDSPTADSPAGADADAEGPEAIPS